MIDGRVFITEVAGKIAISKDGGEDPMLGPIEDVVIDTSTGMVRYLILKSTVKVSDMVDDLGRAVITVKKMQIDGEYVIVTR